MWKNIKAKSGWKVRKGTGVILNLLFHDLLIKFLPDDASLPITAVVSYFTRIQVSVLTGLSLIIVVITYMSGHYDNNTSVCVSFSQEKRRINKIVLRSGIKRE